MDSEIYRNRTLTCPTSENHHIHWRRMCVDHIEVIGYILIPLAIFGVVANVITIIVIVRSPRLRSPINEILLSLCVSDIASSLLSIFFIYGIFVGHLHGDYIGIIISNVSFFIGTFGTSVVTCLHICYFASVRFVSIKWPTRFRRLKPVHVKIFSIVTWICCMVAIVIVMSLELFGILTPLQGSVMATVYLGSIIALAWLVTICSVATGIEIVRGRTKRRYLQGGRESETKRRKKENRAIHQLGLIVGSFYFGYLPISVIFLYKFFSQDKLGIETRTWLFMFEYLCLRFSECLNPIFYNVASKRMRIETRKLVRQVWNCAIKAIGRGSIRSIPDNNAMRSSYTSATQRV